MTFNPTPTLILAYKTQNDLPFDLSTIVLYLGEGRKRIKCVEIGNILLDEAPHD